MIIGIVGSPGSGKTYNLTEIVRGLARPSRAYPQGRTIYANYAMDGARPLVTLMDALSDEFADSIFAISEIGAELDSRSFADLDPLVKLALTQHRKRGVLILYDVQTLELVDINVRRLTEQVVTVQRFGPGGESTRRLLSSRTSSTGRHPYFFVRRWYLRDDVHPEWELEAFNMAHPCQTEVHFFRQRIANSYGSWDTMEPVALIPRLAELRSLAAERAALAPMRVVAGKLQPRIEPAIDGLSIPEHMTAEEVKRARKTMDRKSVLLERLRSFGMYRAADEAPVGEAAHAAADSAGNVHLVEFPSSGDIESMPNPSTVSIIGRVQESLLLKGAGGYYAKLRVVETETASENERPGDFTLFITPKICRLPERDSEWDGSILSCDVRVYGRDGDNKLQVVPGTVQLRADEDNSLPMRAVR